MGSSSKSCVSTWYQPKESGDYEVSDGVQGTRRYSAGDVVYTYIVSSCTAWGASTAVCGDATNMLVRGFNMGKTDDEENALTSATALAAGALTALAALAL